MTSSTLVQQLKDELVALYGEDTLRAELRKRFGPPWPGKYIGSHTGKAYAPHNDGEREIVYSDTPRHQLLKGGEGCLSASTKIMGIPVPEWKSSLIETAFGPSPSTDSYLKGQADLYRVRTAHGEDVEVTADHRFLTPTGWRPLRDLSSGDLIAAHNTQCESPHSHWTEIQDIQFAYHGDFYDLHVPFWNHYSAHGLLHHNSGKSVAGIVKCLDRIKRGCDGLMVSPDMPHFRVSLWKEFRRWCPWDQVVDKHRGRAKKEWEPFAPFTMVFKNSAVLECRGIDRPGSCEGPNVNFVFFDEARHKADAGALKVLDGRVRIPGPNGEPPQMWLTTTPRKNWLFDYYGPLECQCRECGYAEPIAIQEGDPLICEQCGSDNIAVLDEREAFKRNSRVVTLSTKENEGNVEADFAATRSQTLTEAEARVLVDAEWEDIEEGQPYLPHISWWDDCEEELPPLDHNEPLVLAMDAATGRQSGESDCFSIIGITPHPTRIGAMAVRLILTWQVAHGKKLDYVGTELNPGPERELLRLCGWKLEGDNYIRPPRGRKLYNVKCVTYDPNELHDLGMRFKRKHIVWMHECGQLSARIKADTDFLQVIKERRIAHDGDKILRQHMYNADRKLVDGKKLRIVKRSDRLKIDGAVATSMGVAQVLYLDLVKKK